MSIDIQTISLIVSVIGSAVYSTWILGKRCSAIETRMEAHIQATDRVHEVEKEAIRQRIDRLDRHMHDVKNQLQSITLTLARKDLE
jgi:hypothetical protein